MIWSGLDEVEFESWQIAEESSREEKECRVLHWADLILFICVFLVLQKGFGVCVEKWDCRCVENWFAQFTEVWQLMTLEKSDEDKDEEEELEMEWSKEKLMLPKGMAEGAASLKSLVKI